MLPKNFPNRKKKRNQEALERQAKWDSLSPSQKIEELNKRFGVDVGASKQRVKLLMTQFQRQPATRG